jgi:transposase
MTSRAEWTKRVSQWRASGESAGDYASSRGFSERSLRWWAWHLKRARAEASRTTSSVQLVRVERAAKPAMEAVVLEVGLARIRVNRKTDPDAVRVLLAALTERAQ